MRALLLSLVLTSCTIDVDIGTKVDSVDAAPIPADGAREPDAIPRDDAATLPDASPVLPDAAL